MVLIFEPKVLKIYLSTNVLDGISPWTLLVVRNQGILFYPRCESLSQAYNNKRGIVLKRQHSSIVLQTAHVHVLMGSTLFYFMSSWLQLPKLAIQITERPT